MSYYTSVQDTNDSSTLSKVSSSVKGYFVDPFIEKICPVQSCRSPLINRGYYIRCQAIQQTLVTFIQSCKDDYQILSLGAGFDTSYFRLAAQGLLSNLKYVEVDFARVVERKMKFLLASDYFAQFLVQYDFKNGVFHSGDYYIVACNITDTHVLEEMLKSKCGMDFNLPTFILSECVLTYIAPKKVDMVINWCSSSFPNAIMCTYEQVYPEDSFGRTMLSHFKKLNSPLLNIEVYKSPQDLVLRYKNLGWSFSKFCDMNTYYLSLALEERTRVDNLEPFDEFEEFGQKCSHYILLCVCSAALVSVVEKVIPAQFPHSSTFPELNVQLQEVKLEISSEPLQRYGHSSIKVTEDDIIVIGGYGKSFGSCHKRLDDIIQLKILGDGSVSTSKLNIEGTGPGSILYHKVVLLSGRKVLVTGGRQSPSRPNMDIYVLTISQNSGIWKKIVLSPDSDMMTARWRHSATLLNLNGEECVLLAGGRNLSAVHNDCFIVNTNTWKIEKVCKMPDRRHSHTAIENGNSVIIMGGLDQNYNHTRSCLKIQHDILNGTWSVFPFHLTSPITERYSMSSCLVQGDEAYILGGVGNSLSVYLTKLHLKTMLSQTYDITNSTKEINFLHFGCTLHYFKEHLLLVGGGGNCFSFGTHFNSLCRLKLEDHFE